MRAICDWCEEEREIEFRVDTIERGDGFSYDVCAPCRETIEAEFGVDPATAFHVERVGSI